MKNLERITYLLDRVQERLASDAECQELIQLIRADEEGIVVGAIDAFHEGREDVVLPDFGTSYWRAPLRVVLGADKMERAWILPVRWMAAAVVAGILVVGGWFWLHQGRRGVDGLAGHDIAPGRNGAVLTLADNRQVVLDSLGNGVIATQGGAAVTLLDGKIEYGKSVGTETLYNTLVTPRGRQFRLVLPDGTAVWLNAASELKYPAVFGDSVRRVELKGEAYFEVAKDVSHAFEVESAGQRVRVLGTAFNVNAYEDEASVRTVLVDGGVAVEGAGTRVVLKGGEASEMKGGELMKGEGDVEEATAWKNGYFVFNGEDIHSVMRKLVRWYDVDVAYEGEAPSTKFYGTVQRFVDISQILQKLEKTNEVHFKIEGRTIMISK